MQCCDQEQELVAYFAGWHRAVLAWWVAPLQELISPASSLQRLLEYFLLELTRAAF